MDRSLTSNWAWCRGNKEKDLVKNEENTIPREEGVTLKKKKVWESKIHSFIYPGDTAVNKPEKQFLSPGSTCYW